MRNKKIYYLLFISILLLSFLFTSCDTSQIKTTEVETTATTIVETTTPQTTVAETISPETTIAETIADNKDYELFRNAIKDYDPISKAVEYATTAYEIELEALKAMDSGKLITDEEKGTKYMDLAIKIQGDYLVFGVLKEKILDKSGIQNITPEMIKAIDLINKWADTLHREYAYTAKHYWGEGAEYEIKADELSEEVNAIMDEYIALKALMY